MSEKLSEKFNPEQPHEDEIEQSEAMRLHKAKEFGLADDASWKEIINVENEHIISSSAKVLGLSEDASWAQVNAAENGQGDRISSALLLGLDRDASFSEITVERDRRKKELHQKIAQQMRGE
jgi:hypothetical protein